MLAVILVPIRQAGHARFAQAVLALRNVLTSTERADDATHACLDRSTARLLAASRLSRTGTVAKAARGNVAPSSRKHASRARAGAVHGRLIGVERYLEVGTFTGYSALAIALALGHSSTIVTCDIDPDTTRIAQRYWREARVADRIELRLGPALSTLDGMLTPLKGG